MYKDLGLVPVIGPGTDTKVPDAFEHVIRIDPRSSANGLERCREEGVTYRDEAVDEVGMQSVGPGAVSLQCTGEPMLGYQELHEQSHPCPQSRLGRCTLREHLWARVRTRLDLVSVYGDH